MPAMTAVQPIERILINHGNYLGSIRAAISAH
jgi:hypothetical protein